MDMPAYDPTKVDFRGVTKPRVRQIIALGYLYLHESMTLPGTASITAHNVGSGILQIVDQIIARSGVDIDEDALGGAVGVLLSGLANNEAEYATATGAADLQSYFRVSIVTSASLAMHALFGELEEALTSSLDLIQAIQAAISERKRQQNSRWN